MDRRHFIIALSAVVALFGMPPARAECDEPGAREHVETLYQAQARRHAEGVRLDDEEHIELFSRNIRKLIRAPRVYPPEMPEGPILDAFFGWGVLPRTEVIVGKTRLVSGQDEGPATVSVELAYRGTAHKVRVHVVRQEERWRIANVIYDNGRSMLDHYRRTTAP